MRLVRPVSRVRGLMAVVALLATTLTACAADNGVMETDQAATESSNTPSDGDGGDISPEDGGDPSVVDTDSESEGSLSGAKVEWFDLSWTLGAVTEEDGEEEGSIRIVAFEVSIFNPLTDTGYAIPIGWLSLRTNLGERFGPYDAENLRDGTSDGFFELEPEGAGEWQMLYEVPAAIALSDLVVELGTEPDRTAVVSPSGVDVNNTVVDDVELETTSWQGPYSMDHAELVLTGAFASTTAGQYDDGRTRPEPLRGNRQADEQEVFVHLDFDITEVNTSEMVSGILIGEIRIVADERPTICGHDGFGTIHEETVSFSATCPVPVDASKLVLEVGTDACTGGCDEWEWTSDIDSTFLDQFTP